MAILTFAFIIMLPVGIAEWALVNDSKEEPCGFCTPKEIYDETRLNYFGVAIVFILITLLLIPYYMVLLIYWLLHVGRKETKS